MTDWGIIQSEGTKKRGKHRKLIEFSVEFLAFNNIFLLFGLVIAIFSLQKWSVQMENFVVFQPKRKRLFLHIPYLLNEHVENHAIYIGVYSEELAHDNSLFILGLLCRKP